MPLDHHGLVDSDLFRSQAFVTGDWRDAEDGRTMTINDPATGAAIGTVPLMGAAETKAAIDAADAAWPAWRARTALDRGAVLLEWRRLILAAQDDLARIMTLEMGKPLAEARGEIGYAASFIEWFAAEGQRAYGDVTPPHQPGVRMMTLRQPVGVSAAITPWNFPAAMITRKAAPALAAGCPMVIKPAPATPYSALALAVLAERAGVPAGVLSVITGDAQAIGGEMCANPTVRKLTFTGSTAVGRLLLRQCADTVKKVSLELGGNAPFIIFDDADLDAALDGLIASKFRNAGQTCVCANRIYVQSGIHDALRDALAARIKSMRVGPGLEDGVVIGPLVNDAAAEKVHAHIADATDKGAEIVEGGGRDPRGGRYVQPTLITGATTDMRLAHEETFGPLAALFRFDTEEEVVAAANASEYGLAAYVYTRDLARSWRMTEALESGLVGLNAGMVGVHAGPFGGVKQSGLGREGARQGLDEFLETKFVVVGGI